MRPCMWSACSLMTRKNCRTSAGPRARKVPSTVEVEPLIEISGVRSSWLTRLRNWALCRSSSSRGSRSCIVTTTDTTSPAAPRLGVALTSVLTLRPSGTESTISSARTVSGVAELLRQREPPQGDLPPVVSPNGHPLQQLLHGAVRRAQALDDPGRFPVERREGAGLRIEDGHADRRCVDEGLHVRSDPLLVPVGTGVDDRRRRLRGEQRTALLLEHEDPVRTSGQDRVRPCIPPPSHAAELRGEPSREDLVAYAPEREAAAMVRAAAVPMRG